MAPGRRGRRGTRAQVTAPHPSGPGCVAPVQKTMQHLEEQTRVLEGEINHAEPPSSRRRHTKSHATWQSPPVQAAVAFHTKARRGQSILASTPFGRGRTDMANNGRAERTAVAMVRRPPIGISERRHPGNLFVDLGGQELESRSRQLPV
jgi:hypothetical protein